MQSTRSNVGTNSWYEWLLIHRENENSKGCMAISRPLQGYFMCSQLCIKLQFKRDIALKKIPKYKPTKAKSVKIELVCTKCEKIMCNYWCKYDVKVQSFYLDVGVFGIAWDAKNIIANKEIEGRIFNS